MKRFLVGLLVLLPTLAVAQVSSVGVSPGFSNSNRTGTATALVSGTTTITSGADKSVCFDDGGVINCADATLQYTKGTGSLAATTFVGALTGNSSTATALGANPTDCAGGQFAIAIAANGDLTCDTPTGGIAGSGTAGLMPIWATTTTLGDSNAFPILVANEGVTGTTVNKLVKFTSAGTAIITSAAETAGILGVVKGGAGTTGSAQVTVIGGASCVSDNATTSGHYAVVSASVAGDCSDSGSTTFPSAGTQVVGLWTETGVAGTRTFFFGTPDVASASSGGGGGGNKNPAGAQNDIQLKGSGNNFAADTGAFVYTPSTGALLISKSLSGSAPSLAITNTSATNSSTALIALKTSSGTGRDSMIAFDTGAGTYDWLIGSDTSLSAFVIYGGANTFSSTNEVVRFIGAASVPQLVMSYGAGGSLVTAPSYTFLNDTDTGFYHTASNDGVIGVTSQGVQVARFLTHEFDVTGSNPGAASQLGVDNTSNTAGSDALIELNQGGGSSGGDPVIGFRISGGQSYSLGTDNSDSDKFKLSRQTDGVGTNDVFAVDTSGNTVFTGKVTSTATADLGWTVQNATNQACNSTCTTGACVVGIDTITTAFLACTDATADSCLCAG
jgi:hypothetical protein